MSDTLMALGAYRFSLDTSAYQQLQRNTQYRWSAQNRLQRSPAQQFVGPGSDTLTLSGVIYPEHKGGFDQINAMRAQAGLGQPLLLVDGLGVIWGRWVITSVEETQTVFLQNGQPKKQEFQLQLTRYGSDS